MPRPVGKTTYLPGLDGLRTIAVVAVLLYHLSVPHAGGGLLGVGVFFTLSGFLITSILVRQWDNHGHVQFGKFWLHRFRRLVPAVVVVLITVLLLTAFLERSELRPRTWEALSALFYYNNWYEIVNGDSYFAMFQGQQPLGHMWSLAVEEQFYLIWPLLFTLVMWIGSKMSRSHTTQADVTANNFSSNSAGTSSASATVKKNRPYIFPAVCALILAVASAGWMAYLVQPGLDHTRVYEGTDTRAAGLLIGAALAFVWRPAKDAKRTAAFHVMSTAIGLIGLVGIIAMMVVTTENDLWLYRGGFVVLAILTCAVLFGLAVPGSAMNKILGVGPLRWLGERSYGIYLWHVPVIAFAPEGFVKHHLWIAAPVLSAISILLAALSWKLVEDPIRQHGPIALVKQWWTGSGSTSRRGLPPVLAGTASVMMVALLAAGVPKALADGTASSSKASDPMAALGGSGTDGAVKAEGTGDSNSTNNEAAGSSAGSNGAESGQSKIDCSTVIHIGDSTSIALNSEDYLPNPNDRVGAQYKRVGAKDVYLDIKGARAVIEHYKSDPNALEVVQNMKSNGYKDACWVMALGTNDAANVQAGNATPAADRIRMIMDVVKDQKHVLWPTLKTINTDQPPYANAGMQKYNQALKQACKEYPNLRLYDWASEVRDDWYISDGIHPNSVGAKERSRRFADALAKAFPAGGKPASQCMVDSGDN